MWTNKQSSDSSVPSSGVGVETLPEPALTRDTAPTKVMEVPSIHGSAARVPSWLGTGLKIKGQISGAEDLQVECNVDGPISIGGHRLTIGQNAHARGDIVASEVIVYGRVNGNLLADDRIEIKKDASVIGDLTTARIMIEDGAYFKGAVEIARKPQRDQNLDTLLARPGKKIV
jgi:cytoskeletal protein CcmA (bactofilin family)